MTAQQVLDAKRAHWGSVENGLHYTLDVTFSEDASRMHAKNIPVNMNAVRQMAYNVLRLLPNPKGGFRAKQDACMLNGGVFSEAIGIAMRSSNAK